MANWNGGVLQVVEDDKWIDCDSKDKWVFLNAGDTFHRVTEVTGYRLSIIYHTPQHLHSPVQLQLSTQSWTGPTFQLFNCPTPGACPIPEADENSQSAEPEGDNRVSAVSVGAVKTTGSEDHAVCSIQEQTRWSFRGKKLLGNSELSWSWGAPTPTVQLWLESWSWQLSTPTLQLRVRKLELGQICVFLEKIVPAENSEHVVLIFARRCGSRANCLTAGFGNSVCAMLVVEVVVVVVEVEALAVVAAVAVGKQ